MIRALLASAFAGTLVFSVAAAAQDARLVERLYNPNSVVRIDGHPNVQATIRFAEDEHIENVAIGDSTLWQVTPNKRANLLFVKPLGERAATNMTVVTDRHTYLFDLVAKPQTRNPLYVLSFTYPQVKGGAAEAAGAPVEGPSTDEIAAATDPYAVVNPANLNFAWRPKGAPQLLPAKVYDDGDATFLTWPAGVTMPAILVKNQQGVEGPVNYAVRGDVIVVDGVPGEIVLRAGGEVANLLNDGPPRQQAPPPSRPQVLAQATPAEKP